MRIVVLMPRARDQRTGLGQGGDHGEIGIAELALVVDHALAFEARRVLGEEAGLVDGEGDDGVDAARFECGPIVLPHLEILGAVARRGMNEASAGVFGDMLAGEQRHVEIVAAAAQRVGRRGNFGWLNFAAAFERGYPRGVHHALSQSVRQQEQVALLGPVVLGRFRHLVQAV